GFVIREINRINVLIGKNNCGKSNILSALQLLKQIRAPVQGFSPWNPLVDSYNQSGKAVVVTACIPTDAILRPADLQTDMLRNARGKFSDILDVRWNTQSGRIEGTHPFNALSLTELQTV